jgi:hypothetical protein
MRIALGSFGNVLADGLDVRDLIQYFGRSGYILLSLQEGFRECEPTRRGRGAWLPSATTAPTRSERCLSSAGQRRRLVAWLVVMGWRALPSGTAPTLESKRPELANLRPGITDDARDIAVRDIPHRCHSDVFVDKNLARHATPAVAW